jgi:hypothetical protein
LRKQLRNRNQKDDSQQAGIAREAQLGEVVTVGDYAIQPPRDFTLVEKVSDDVTWRWMASVAQPNAPILQLSVMRRDKKKPGNPSVISRAGGASKISAQQALSVPGAQTELVRRGEFRMVRAFIHHSQDDPGITRAYSMYDADHWVVIQFYGVDDDPQSMAILEASVASFRLANPPQGDLYPVAAAPPVEQEQTKMDRDNRRLHNNQPLAPSMRPPAQRTEQDRPVFNRRRNR